DLEGEHSRVPTNLDAEVPRGQRRRVGLPATGLTFGRGEEVPKACGEAAQRSEGHGRQGASEAAVERNRSAAGKFARYVGRLASGPDGDAAGIEDPRVTLLRHRGGYPRDEERENGGPGPSHESEGSLVDAAWRAGRYGGGPGLSNPRKPCGYSA